MSSSRGFSSLLTWLALMLLCALIAAMILYGVSSEARDGIVHHKRGGMSLQATEPFWFWLDMGLQVAIGILFAALSMLWGYLCLTSRR
jgi:hypothetical protein